MMTDAATQLKVTSKPSVTNSGMPTSRFVSSIIEYVMIHFAEEISLEDLSDAACMSRFNLCRRFQQECGITPMRWLWAFRTLLASEFITLDPYWSLTDVAFSCGFTSSAHFSRSFKQLFKQSPSAYRKARQAAALQKPGKPNAGSYDSLFVHNEAIILKAAGAAMAISA
jgi:transcriptional regulator GlxA family with amidase domain